MLRLVENAHKKAGVFNGSIKIQPVESMLVILGYGAIYINFIFNIFLLVSLVSKEKKTSQHWLNRVNFLFLIVQIYYFFFSNF